MKKVLLTAVLVLFVVLAACGDERSNKEVVADAFDNMMNAESYESSSTVDFELSGNMNDPMFDQVTSMLNDFELQVDQAYDQEAQMQEVVMDISGSIPPLSLDVKLPFLQDLENQVMYMRTDSLADNLGMMFPIPEEAKGKLVKMDLQNMQGVEGEDMPEMEQEEMQERSQAIFKDFIEQKDEGDFTQEENRYSVSITKEDFRYLMEAFMEEFDEMFTQEEVDTFNQDFDTMMKEMDEVLTVEQFDMSMVIEDDQVQENTLEADLLFEDPESDESMQFYTNVQTTYSNRNGDVEFSIDPENEETISFEELNQMMNDMMMQDMGGTN
ncbi:hypothetical protein [Alkalibacillus almallahensis]|uniref:hypothetical protein n=1 Tax=Alkalibacillus almallahensis TaxID=1379154 RepID=UPI0014211E82|nr:hypothetical protein [Alkalibacillus almallahensis]NIK13050.1 hypothetical protein [Alkalibacillus almallahensis]